MNGKQGDNRALLVAIRQCLIMALGAIEDYMGLPHSIEPKHKRQDKRQVIRE